MQPGWLNPYRGLLIALALTALLEANLVARSGAIGADGMLFVHIAHQLQDDPVTTFRAHDQHPGFPAMVLASSKIVHIGYPRSPESWMLSAQLVTALFGLGTVALVWFFARELFDTTVANVAAFVLALLPIPRTDAAGGQSDTPHAFFFVLAAWMASSAIARGEKWRLAAAGAASSVAYWIRPEGWEVFLLATVALAIQAVRDRWGWRHWGAVTASLAAPAIVIAAPYLLIAGKITSKQMPFADSHVVPTFIEQRAETAPEAPPSGLAVAETKPPEAAPRPATEPAAIPVVVAEPKRVYTVKLFVRLLGDAIGQLVICLGQGFKIIFIPFYLLSWVALNRRKADWVQVAFLTALGTLHMLTLIAVYFLSGYIWHRHVLPLVVLAMPFTALGVVTASDWAAQRWRLARLDALVGTMALAVAPLLHYDLRPFNREFLPVIEATRWVAEHAQPGTGIVTNSPYVNFFGAMPTTEVGPKALTVEAALACAPPGVRYDYVVLHVGAHGYRPEWIEQLSHRYREVRRWPDPLSPPSRHREVIVFEALEQSALHDAVNDRRRS